MTQPSGAARVTGLIGWPVKHSLSPGIHNYWFDRHGLDAVYAPLPVAPENIPAAIAGLRALGFAGVNVTVPHKQAVIGCLDRLDGAAERIGAVNTIIVHKDGALVGHNTDAYGFLTGLRSNAGPALIKIIQQNHTVTMIGAGGAARAVLDAVLQAGFRRVAISNRTEASARDLATQFQQYYPQAELFVLPWERRAEALPETGLLVNTTSLGMTGAPPLSLPLDALNPDAIVADIVYVPLVTGLLARARARGHLTIDGLDMLLYQAEAAFEAWHGVRPTVDAALRQHLLDQIIDED